MSEVAEKAPVEAPPQKTPVLPAMPTPLSVKPLVVATATPIATTNGLRVGATPIAAVVNPGVAQPKPGQTAGLVLR